MSYLELIKKEQELFNTFLLQYEEDAYQKIMQPFSSLDDNACITGMPVDDETLMIVDDAGGVTPLRGLSVMDRHILTAHIDEGFRPVDRLLTVKEHIEVYDKPLLMICDDDAGRRYVCLSNDCKSDDVIAVELTEESERKFKNDRIDLLELLESSPKKFTGSFTEEGILLTSRALKFDAPQLPKPGYFYRKPEH